MAIMSRAAFMRRARRVDAPLLMSDADLNTEETALCERTASRLCDRKQDHGQQPHLEG
jgi:hypothetical protein